MWFTFVTMDWYWFFSLMKTNHTIKQTTRKIKQFSFSRMRSVCYNSDCGVHRFMEVRWVYNRTVPKSYFLWTKFKNKNTFFLSFNKFSSQLFPQQFDDLIIWPWFCFVCSVFIPNRLTSKVYFASNRQINRQINAT